MSEEKSKSQRAFTIYEKAFSLFKNAKMHESNKHPVGDFSRIEHDLSEIEKAHLDLLRSKLEMELANEAIENSEELSDKTIESSEKLSKRVFWLNIAAAALSAALVITAILELKQ